ncbi:MAG: polysaccharide deacetylase family protein, partial [Candidatus Eremiobacteraeota bacterium]|nr:polysaccharide deacetylase family protein [Candidatus Eremiobacteraeota bacterium]
DAGARATFYIVTGNVGKKNHVTWTEIATMARAGMDIGAHGLQHFELPAMSAQQQAAQINGSAAIVRERVGLPVESYAYPSGRFDRRTLSIVAASGIPLAVTTDPVANQNRFDLGRVRVRGSWTGPEFRAAVRRALAQERPVEKR